MSKDKRVIELKYPIEIPIEGSDEVKVIKSLTFGRVKAKHLRSLPEGLTEDNSNISVSDMIPIIASLADITIDQAGELDMEDLTEVAEVLQDFLGGSQQTGKN